MLLHAIEPVCNKYTPTDMTTPDQCYTHTAKVLGSLDGLKGIIGTINIIEELPVLTIDKVCNNKESINQVNEILIFNNILSPKADVILACQKFQNEMKVSIVLCQVKGH